MSIKKLASLSILLFLLNACAGHMDLRGTASIDKLYGEGHFTEAALEVGGEEGNDYDKENLLVSLQAGTIFASVGQWSKSIEAFDAAERTLIWKADEIDSVGEVIQSAGTFLTNDLAAPYGGNVHEGVLLNTFKAVDSLMLENEAQARVEFNRAAQRNLNAKEQLQVKLRAIQASEEEPDKVKYDGHIQQTMQKVSPDIQKRLETVATFEDDQDIRNPFTEYLHGVFRLVTNDTEKATNFLRDANGLSGLSNPYVLRDFELAEETANGMPMSKRVWVVYEDGLGPTYKEFRIDLPVFFFSSNVLYSGIALPEMVLRDAAHGSLMLETTEGQYKTETLLDVDRLVGTEFKLGYNAVVAKAVSSAVVKTIVQAIVNQQIDDNVGGIWGLVGKVAVAATQAITTRADTRAWTTLPKTISVASFPKPENGVVTLQTPAGLPIAEINLPESDFALIRVKAVNKSHVPVYNVVPLGEREAMRHAHKSDAKQINDL